MATRSIAELATIISTNTAIITEYLSNHGLAQPSFDVIAPSQWHTPTDAPHVEAARSAVIDATLMLHDLILGPKAYLMSFTVSISMHQEAQDIDISKHDWLLSMQAISRFNIARSFPVHEEASFADIAKTCGVNELDVRRILRHAMTKRIFHESRKGFVTHTAVSRLLAEDSQMADWVGTNTDELWQAASQTVNAMVKWPGSQEPNQTVCDTTPH